MYLFHAYVTVGPGAEDEFAEACVVNSRASLEEPGCLTFDVLQQADDPTRFVLVEAYRSEDDLAAHKTTDHYKAWAEVANRVQVEPRSKTVFTLLAG
ncbi:putative quinol monooxygenase [Tessaracoccus sp. Y1736]